MGTSPLLRGFSGVRAISEDGDARAAEVSEPLSKMLRSSWPVDSGFTRKRLQLRAPAAEESAGIL